MHKSFGYVRVSSKDQNVERQLVAMESRKKIFTLKKYPEKTLTGPSIKDF